MREALKKVCPQCGQEVMCFSPGGIVVDGLFLKDEYIAVCCGCGWWEKRMEHAGKTHDIPQKTVCPFCGKPQDEHCSALSEREVLPLMRLRQQRAKKVGAIRSSLPQDSGKQVISLTHNGSGPSRRTACTVLPPRKPRRRTMFEKMTIKQILAFFTIVSAVIPGVGIFIVNMMEESTFVTALLRGLATLGSIGIVMFVFSALIFYDYRRHYNRST
jgi:hypothetical protein